MLDMGRASAVTSRGGDEPVTAGAYTPRLEVRGCECLKGVMTHLWDSL